MSEYSAIPKTKKVFSLKKLLITYLCSWFVYKLYMCQCTKIQIHRREVSSCLFQIQEQSHVPKTKLQFFFQTIHFFCWNWKWNFLLTETTAYKNQERVTRWCHKLTNNMIKTVLPEKEFSIKIVEICANVLRAIALAKVENIMMIFFPFWSVIYVFVVEI